MLRHLDMIAEDEVINTGITWLSDYKVITNPRWHFQRSYQGGGYFVAENAVLGVLMDFFGNELLTIRAPFAGVVNYVISTPP